MWNKNKTNLLNCFTCAELHSQFCMHCTCMRSVCVLFTYIFIFGMSDIFFYVHLLVSSQFAVRMSMHMCIWLGIACRLCDNMNCCCWLFFLCLISMLLLFLFLYRSRSSKCSTLFIHFVWLFGLVQAEHYTCYLFISRFPLWNWTEK